MHIPKRYGEGKIDTCPFCGKQALIMNFQNIPVCAAHKEMVLPELKCICGSVMLMQKGKFGVYFNCLKCGNMSLYKALDINDVKIKGQLQKKEPVNMIIRSDDPNFFD